LQDHGTLPKHVAPPTAVTVPLTLRAGRVVAVAVTVCVSAFWEGWSEGKIDAGAGGGMMKRAVRHT